MIAPLLELRQIARTLGGRAVLDGIDLELRGGDRLTIAGRSGQGKTTLLRIIAGLEAPDRGEVALAGSVASRPGRVSTPPWKRGVQLVFQDLGLWPTRTVLAHLTDVLRARGHSGSDARARSEPVLQSLGIAELAGRKPGSLSGGEARRLAFARALVLEPELILLDEPFSSLDPVARDQGLAFLEEVLTSTQAAVILVTHDSSEARSLGGEVAVLRDGKLAAGRPAAELCADPAAFKAALGE